MIISFPDNIFARLLGLSVSVNHQVSDKATIEYSASPFLAKKLQNGESDVALIPSGELILNKELFVSTKFGLTFDGEIGVSYFYFSKDISNFLIKGDVSINDVIFSKALFKEKYESDPEMRYDDSDLDFDQKSYLIAGDENFNSDLFEKGISLADEISSMLSMPYVNYVLASKNKESLERAVNLFNGCERTIDDNLTNYLNEFKITKAAKEKISDGFNGIYYSISEGEIEALRELLRLPYYIGIVEELFEIKFH